MTYPKFLTLVIALLVSIFQPAFSQTGPGGVGNATGANNQPQNVLWLKSDAGITHSSGFVDAWADQSGNSNNALGAGATRPIYTASDANFNNLPSISFPATAASNFYLEIPDNDNLDNTTQLTVFFVVRPTTTPTTLGILSKRTVASVNQSYYFDVTTAVRYRVAIEGGSVANLVSANSTLGQNDIVSFVMNAGTKSGYLDGGNTTSPSTANAINNNSSNLFIGTYDASNNNGLEGQLVEVLIYRTVLNAAQRQIVENYLSSKYNSTLTSGDVFGGDVAGGSTLNHDFDLAGIGQASGTQHLLANSKGLILSPASGTLDTNGEFLLTAHNGITNAAVTTNLGTGGVVQRWNRTWYIDKTGTLDGVITFDFSDGIGGQFPQNKDNYVLLRRNTGTGNYDVVTIANSEKSVIGDQLSFQVGNADLVDGVYTLGTLDLTNSPVTGVSNRTWYSYLSGNWSDPNSWTLDGGVIPLLVNPSNEVPGIADNVVITSGRTISMNINNVQTNSIEVTGKLDLNSTTGHNFVTIKGSGTIQIAGATDNFPAGTSTDFADGSIGGTLEINGAGIDLNADRTFNNVVINLNGSSDAVVLTSNYTINGNLTISNGLLQFNNTTIANRQMTVLGDVLVESTGGIRVGVSVSSTRHEFNLYGDFTNEGGTAYFTQRGTAITGSEATDGIVDVNLLSANQDQVVTCNGVTRFYRIEINKGTDDTYKASINASAPANFNLFGYANEGHANIDQLTTNNNAFGLIYGTVEIGANVSVLLNTTGNYNISEGARLTVSGGSVTKTGGNAIVAYGVVRLTDGTITANTIDSGITLRDNGTILVEGGTLTLRAIRTSVNGAGAVGSYIQSGGTVLLDGGGVSADYAVFSLTYPGNVFNMSGGTLTIQNRSSLGTDNLRGAVFINSDPANVSVTGGTVIFEADNAIAYRVTSRAAFWNVIVRATGGARTLELLGTTSGSGTAGVDELTVAIQPLTALNDLTIENNANLTTNNANVSISGSFEIVNGGIYTHGTNTTTLSGAGVGSLTFGNTGTTQTFNNLTVNKASATDQVIIANGNATAIRVNGIFTLSQGIFNYSNFILSARSTISLSSGTVIGSSGSTGRLLMDGTADQTIISNNASIYNLEINNTDATPVVTLSTNNLTILGTLTLTSGIFDLNTQKLTLDGALAAIAGSGFGTSKMIQLAGNAGDGGLELYYNANEVQTFPIGTNANSTVRYTPATVQLQNFSDDGYIRISIEDRRLQLASLSGSNALTYNWRVIQRAFTTLPTVSYQFNYNETDVGGSEGSYVPGSVTTSLPFTGSGEAGSDINTTTNILTFNGTSTGGTFPGNGFTLVSAAYTAGANALFSTSPEVFYNRNNGQTGWSDNNKWSLVGFNGTATNQEPGPGDIVMMKNFGENNGNGWVNMDSDVEVAAIIFDDTGGGWSPRITVQNGRTVSLGVVSGSGTIMVEANGTLPTLNNTDIGDFANQTASFFIYKVENNATYNMYSAFTEYPNLRIEGNDGGSNNGLRVMRNTTPVTVNRDLWMDWGGTFRAEASLTIGRDMRPGAGGGGGGRFQFGENGSHTVYVVNDILSTNSANNRIEVVNTTPSTRIHTLNVGGDITQTTGIIDLYNGAGTANNAILEVSGSTSAAYSNASGNTPDLFRLTVNKGSSISSTFTLSDNMTLNGPFDQITKPLTLQNGLLIIDDPDINYTLTSGGGDFNIPATAGLEVKQGSVSTSTTSTNANITLDGLLRVSGGTVNVNGGGAADTNYIEYSNSGNAAIEISSGALTVAGQVRRQLTSTTGVLKYTQSGGTALFGNESASTTNRGVFEVLNTGSEFNHSGGSFTIVRGINSATVPSLWLEPNSASVTAGSTITIGNSSTPSGVNSQNIGIQSTVALNNLTIAGSNNPVAKIYISPLTVSGILTVSPGTSLDANGQGLTIGSDFIVDGSFIPNANVTTFANAGAASISGSTPLFNFYDFVKTGVGTLSLGKDITINRDLTLSAGTFASGIYSVTLRRNAKVDATHTATSGGGIIFNGSSQQQLTRSTAGTSTLGIVTINNSSGVIIPDGNGYNFNITNNLRLQNGVFDIGGSLLFLQVNALITPVNAYSVTNMIQTNSSFTDFGVRKQFPTNYITDFVFPVGQLLYTPVTFRFSGVGQTTGSSLTPTITVRPANERHPTIVEDGEAPDPEIDDLQNVLQYHWIINADNVASTFVSEMQLTYDQSLVAVTAPYTENDYIPARILSDGNPGGNIDKFSSVDIDAVTNVIKFTFTSTSDPFISGEYFAGIDSAIPNIVPTYTVIASGNANTAIYSPAVPSGGVPSGALVIVPSPFNLTLAANNDNVSFYKLEIESGATVTIASGSIGNRLGIVTGQGDLRLEGPSPVLPAAVYDDFFSCIGGGLVYAGTGNYEVLGGITALRNLTIEGSGVRTFGNNDVSICNNLIINSASLNTNGRTLNVGNDLLLAGGIYNLNTSTGSLTVTRDLIQSSGSFFGGSGGTKSIGRDLIISGGSFTAGSGTNVISIGRNMTVADAATFTGGSSSTVGLLFQFNGSAVQTLTGTFTDVDNRRFNRLEINNSAGLILSGNLTIERQVLFTNGVITPGVSEFLFKTTASASPVNGSSTSFVNGKLYKVLNTTTGFTFPIGKGNIWRPASISNVSATGDTWDAEYFYAPATQESIVDNLTPVSPILTLAQGEYWKISDGAAIGRTARVGLSWGTVSDVSAVLAEREALQVVAWNDALSRWDNYGGTNFSAGHTQAAGSFSSNVALSFSENIVTLGSTETANPLPVELLSFSGKNENGFNKIKWVTVSELDNDFFELERSANGEEFRSIGKIKGKGTTNELSTYIFDDEAPLVGNNYYRLKQVDFNGAFEYSNIILVKNNSEGTLFNLSVFPNPVSKAGELTIRSLKDNELEAMVTVRDITGKVIAFYSIGTETLSEKTLSTSAWSGTGVYIVEMKQGEKRVFRRVIVD